LAASNNNAETIMTESTQLTAPERAEKALAFAETKAQLAELAQQSARIVEVTNPDGREECHRARMTLKNTRVAIQKTGKDARDDAVQFSKAVIAKEKELIDVIAPEESRLQSLQDAWDTEREAERQAKVRAEQERVEAIQQQIADVRAYAHEAVGKGSEAIAVLIAELEPLGPSEAMFQEFREQADVARSETLAKLQDMHAAAAAHEAEQARIAEEQAAERAKIEAERAELAKLREEAAERDRQAAAERAEADRIAAEQREEAARAEREQLAAERAEQEKAAAEERERLAAERDALAREQAEGIRKAQEEARKARQREIDTATLVEAATEALPLLQGSHPDHIATHKLAAALARETESRIAAGARPRSCRTPWTCVRRSQPR
jgi:hypothetical protein